MTPVFILACLDRTINATNYVQGVYFDRRAAVAAMRAIVEPLLAAAGHEPLSDDADEAEIGGASDGVCGGIWIEEHPVIDAAQIPR